MKTIHFGLATVLSCLISGVSYACALTLGPNGKIGVGTSNPRLLSSKPSQSATGQAGSFTANKCINQIMRVTQPVPNGSNPPLTTSQQLAEIYSDSVGSILIADSKGKSYKISSNGSIPYYTHMSITADNPLLPGSYNYIVPVTITTN